MPVPDVAIIGGGIVGVATAAILAGRGARVTLYERGAGLAAAASGRNAGLIIEPPDPVLTALYRESLEQYRALSGERLDEDAAFTLPASPIGVLAVAADADLVRRVAARGSAGGAGTPEILDGRQLTTLEPLLAEHLTAFQFATGYPVRPSDATRAFALVASEAGARLVTTATAIPWIERGVARGVEVAGKRIGAGCVVVAAGPWTPPLVDPDGDWRPIQPLWGVLVEMELPLRPRHVLEELTGDDGLLLSGDDDVDADPKPIFTMNPGTGAPGAGGPAVTNLGNTLARVEPNAERVAPNLIRHAQRFVPSLHARQVRGIRACPRPQAFDGRPLIGFVPGVERLVVAAGNGAWGISTGPATARFAADAVLAGDDSMIPTELRAGRSRPSVRR